MHIIPLSHGRVPIQMDQVFQHSLRMMDVDGEPAHRQLVSTPLMKGSFAGVIINKLLGTVMLLWNVRERPSNGSDCREDELVEQSINGIKLIPSISNFIR